MGLFRDAYSILVGGIKGWWLPLEMGGVKNGYSMLLECLGFFCLYDECIHSH